MSSDDSPRHPQLDAEHDPHGLERIAEHDQTQSKVSQHENPDQAEGQSNQPPAVIDREPERPVRWEQNSEEDRAAKRAEKRRRREERQSLRKWEVGATVAIAAFAVVQLVAAVLQYITMQDQLTASERAWVLPRAPKEPMDLQKVVNIPMVYWNPGKSPASNVSIKIGYGISPSDLPPIGRTMIDRSGFFIPPGADNGVGNAIWLKLGSPLFEMITVQKDTEFHIGGVITYDDAVGRGRKTTWCLKYAPPSRDFVFCEGHNSLE